MKKRVMKQLLQEQKRIIEAQQKLIEEQKGMIAQLLLYLPTQWTWEILPGDGTTPAAVTAVTIGDPVRVTTTCGGEEPVWVNLPPTDPNAPVQIYSTGEEKD
jgi:hypothetical protein